MTPPHTLTLQTGEVHLWHTEIDQVPDSRASHYLEWLSAEELTRNQRFKFAAGRKNHAVARALVRTVLSRYYPKRCPDDWQFAIGEHGKPEIASGLAELPLRFNLSHSDKRVVCAVALDQPVGVDIEYTQRKNDVLSIADHYFSTSEVAALFALPKQQQEDRFFDYWTLKEAYMKADGQGISLGLGNFSFAIDKADNVAVAFATAIDDDPARWQFRLFRHIPDHRLALAAAAPLAQIRQFELIP